MDAYTIVIYNLSTEHTNAIKLMNLFPFPEEISAISVVNISDVEIRLVVDTATFWDKIKL